MAVLTQELTGWGRTAPSVATVVELDAGPIDGAALVADIRERGRGAIARGLGRSYGDSAQNAGGTVLRLPDAASEISVDADAAVARVGGGVSLDTLLREIVPRGFFVPVSPGTRFVTVGGAIASDIHGKNHHADGSFGDHVTEMTMLLADGSLTTVTPQSTDLWDATVGGMGLTGLIVDATFRLLPVETRHCIVDTQRVSHLDEVMSIMEAEDRNYRYSVAWIDLVATGRQLGRSVLSMANHASLDELRGFDPKAAENPLDFGPRALPDVPAAMPKVLNQLAVRAFNEFWYRKAPKHRHGTESLTSFFHPLDMVGSWNHLYGRDGFFQYQFVMPFDAVDTLRTIIEKVSAGGHASFLAVLKRMGASSSGLLSFPRPGWTLALDLPAGIADLDRLVFELDDLVIGAGGRHYLTKDATLRPEVFAAGYDRLDEWRAIRRRFDPDRIWVSDQARRLDLV